MTRLLTQSTPIRELRVWTISNLLSLSRILLLPFIYDALAAGGGGANATALTLMLIGVATDILDGLIARRTGVESAFGKILDPVADKICIGSMILILVGLRGFPLWLVGLVLARDLLILGAGSVLIGRRRVVLSSNWLGKVTTLSMALLIFAWTLEWQRLYGVLTGVAIVFLAASTTSYGVAMHRQLQAASGRVSRGSGTPAADAPDATGQGRAPGAGEAGRPGVTAR